jgi:hypothetical protein
MPPLPAASIPVWAPFAPLCSDRVWLQAQLVLLGASLAPAAPTVTAAWRAMGRAPERRFTTAHRVWNRVPWAARQGGQTRWGWHPHLPRCILAHFLRVRLQGRIHKSPRT